MASWTRDAGYTLVELITALAVLVVIAALLIPTLTGGLSLSGGRGAAEAVRDAFDFARAQASTTNLAHRIRIIPGGSDGGGEIIVAQGETGSCSFAEDAPTVRRLMLQSEDANVLTTDAGDPTLDVLWTMARIDSVLPDSVLANDVCVRPDGSIRDAITNVPIPAPPGAEQYGSGDVLVMVQDYEVKGASSSPQLKGSPFRIIVPYSGLPRITY